MPLLGVPAPDQTPPAMTAPLAVVRQYRAYYSPLELSHLVHLQAQHPGQPHKLLSDHRIELYRQLAAGYIERVANRLGFPRRTIATAQKLYHRFHLHFPLVEFPYQDVSLAALLVASKLEDTLKKLRDIQIAAWQVQNLLDGGNGAGEGDPAAQEAHRPHLIGIERLILQTICFNLNLHRPLAEPASSSTTTLSDISNKDDLLAVAVNADADAILAAASSLTTGDAFRTLFRLGAALPSLTLPLANLASSSSTATEEPPSKQLTRLAFLLLTDVHRTLAPLSFPPHTCAAACLWLAGYLLGAALATNNGGGLEGAESRRDEQEGGEEEALVWEPEMEQSWAATCESDPRDLGDIAQTLLDLLISLCPPPPLSSSLPYPGNASTGSPHSSLASPSESAALANAAAMGGPKSNSSAATAVTSDREKHLLAAGCPNAFSHPALMPAFALSGSSMAGGRGTNGSAGTKYLGVDELMRVKIRVRKASKRLENGAEQDGVGSSEKRPRESASTDVTTGSTGDDDDDDESTVALKRSRRWTNIDAGLAEVGRIRDERDLKDRIRAEERAERQQQVKQAEAGSNGGLTASTGGEGENSAQAAAAASGMTEEEREKERRERRERLKPGSVRYRF